jgi:signal transduction histidine kinase
MSKIEAGRIRLDPERVELEPFINDAMRVVSGRANDKQITLAARIGGGIRLTADHRLLKQIVLNLLSNAVKFTPEGGRITIRARAAGGWVSVAIADTGIGIPEDALARLGRPFEQVESQLTGHPPGSLASTGKSITSRTRLDAHPSDARPRHHGAAARRRPPHRGLQRGRRRPQRRSAEAGAGYNHPRV